MNNKLHENIPEFFTRNSQSNIMKISKIFDNTIIKLNSFKGELFRFFDLEKKLWIVKIQEIPFKYLIYFVCLFKDIKEVKLYKNDEIVFEQTFNTPPSFFEYFLEDQVSETVVPDDGFIMEVVRENGEIVKKGIPENTTIMNDEYDKDESLDIIGKLLNCPRRTYKTIIDEEDYYDTEPSFCNYSVESDFDYMNRLIEYNQDYWKEPLPVLKVKEKYCLNATLKNRLNETCTINESYIDTEESLENIGIFTTINNINLLKNTNLKYHSYILDTFGRKIEGQLCIYRQDSFYNPSTQEYEFTDFRFTGNLTDYSVKITSNNPFNLIVRYLRPDEELPEQNSILDINNSILSKITYINIVNANWYVSTTGNDNNDGRTLKTAFRTLEKALNIVEDSETIYVDKGEYNLTKTLNFNKDVNIIGDENETPIISSTNNPVWILNSRKNLYLENIKIKYQTTIYNYHEGLNIINKNSIVKGLMER